MGIQLHMGTPASSERGGILGTKGRDEERPRGDRDHCFGLFGGWKRAGGEMDIWMK